MPTIRRFGVLVPSSDSVVEADLKNSLPSFVSFHSARLLHRDDTPRGAPTMDEICAGIEGGLDSLAQISPEFILFGCTSASFYKGPEWGEALRKRIIAYSGVPAIVTSEAVIKATKAIGVSEAFMITPYPEDMNRREIAYFEHHGLSIPDYSFFHLELSRDICLIEPEQIFARAMENAERVRKRGALFISCTGLRAVEIAGALERELSVPVITSNSANLYCVFGMLGIQPQGLDAGRLFYTPHRAA